MPQREHPALQQLEEQLARINARLSRREKGGGGWLGLLGGLGLGALTGGVLAYLLRSRQEEPPYIPPVPSAAAPRRADDAVVLRGTPTPASPRVEQEDDEPILLKTPSAAAPPAEATSEDASDQADASPTVTEAAASLAEPAAIAPTVENEAIPSPAGPTDESEIVPAPVAPTVENEAIPAPAVPTDESAIAPAPVEPTVENEALPAAAIAEAPATTETEAASKPAEAAVTTEAEQPSPTTPAAGAYPGSVAPIGDQCPAGYEIKGNRSRNSDLLYHTPTSNNYARTKPEACFATEEDAEAAGFRKARS